MFLLRSSIFGRPIEFESLNIDVAEVTDCQFSNFVSPSFAINIIIKDSITLNRCFFLNLTGTGHEIGYYIESNRGMVSDTSVFNLENNGGNVQMSVCTCAILSYSNSSNVRVDHISILNFKHCGSASANFINAVDCSAKILGVGAQFEAFSEYASLQKSNFIRINSPEHGVVRACLSNKILYVVRCYFEGLFPDQKAFYGEAQIRVFQCSTNVRDFAQYNVLFDDMEEITDPLHILIMNRIKRTAIKNKKAKLNLLIVLCIYKQLS